MDFYIVRDMQAAPKSLWDSLTADGRVVITSNGKPPALMLDISDGSLEETLRAVKLAVGETDWPYQNDEPVIL